MRHPKFCEYLLAEVPRDVVDDDVLAHIDDASRKAQVKPIILRGLVTGKLWIVFHGPSSKPTRKFIRHAEREELAALPATGAMQ